MAPRLRLRTALTAWLAAASVLVGVAGVQTQPALALPVFDTTFAVFGDYGTNDQNEADVAALVGSLAPDFIVTTGDNFYGGGGSPATRTYDNRVGQYYVSYLGDYSGAYGPGSPSNRFFATPGNHDYSNPAGGIGDYEAFFTLPGTGW